MHLPFRLCLIVLAKRRSQIISSIRHCCKQSHCLKFLFPILPCFVYRNWIDFYLFTSVPVAFLASLTISTSFLVGSLELSTIKIMLFASRKSLISLSLQISFSCLITKIRGGRKGHPCLFLIVGGKHPCSQY